MTSRVAPRWWNLSALGTTVLLALLALGPQPRIPGLSLVDLGFASLGHLAGEAAGVLGAASVLPAIGGLVLSVALPLLLAGRFVRSRAERTAGALCLAWAATVVTALAADLLAAAEPGPAGPGAPSDWTVLLGAQGLGALDRAADVAGALRTGALALFVVAAAVCAAPLVADAVRAVPRVASPAPPLTPAPRRRI